MSVGNIISLTFSPLSYNLIKIEQKIGEYAKEGRAAPWIAVNIKFPNWPLVAHLADP